jgi:hypothetical protein
MSTTRLFYARAVLAKAAVQRGAEQEQALVAIFTGEDSTAQWNPGDTTLKVEPCSPYNSFGPGGEWHVWNYEKAAQGVDATVDTLLQPNMSRFYEALRLPGATAEELCRAFSMTPWGGIGDVLPLEIVQDWNAGRRNYTADRAVAVHGTGGWPYKTNGDLMG